MTQAQAPNTRNETPDVASTDRPGDRLAPLLPGGEPIKKLLRKAQFFQPGTPTPDHRELHRIGGRNARQFYHERWRHDKEAR